MEVILRRDSTSDKGTFGTMVLNDEQICLTVERPYTGDHPCIPAGTYAVEPYNSPKHGDVWQVMDVPGRTNIEIHPANLANQLLGCIAPGASLGIINGLPGVTNSQKTFSMLKSRLLPTFTLTITENF